MSFETPVLVEPGASEDHRCYVVSVDIDQREGQMNNAIMKKMLIALAVLAMATMTACDLSAPVDTGNSVEVVMGGLEGAGGAKGIGGDATWVSIRVVNSSGLQVGSGDLTKTGSFWHGKISVSETGQMTFTATVGSEDARVLWIGKNTYNVGMATGSLTIFVDPPAVATAADNGYGPAGGKIFYDNGSYTIATEDTPSWRYLEAAPIDQSDGIHWYNGAHFRTGATGKRVGSGKANTTAIISTQMSGSYAASLCTALYLGGYYDWYLPSLDELNWMYTNLMLPGLGGFASAWYWSSSEDDNSFYFFTKAWIQNFANGSGFYVDKGNGGLVRAVRAFCHSEPFLTMGSF